jgi:hypothetical protein
VRRSDSAPRGGIPTPQNKEFPIFKIEGIRKGEQNENGIITQP